MPPEILDAFRRSLPPGTCEDTEKLQALLAEGILASGCALQHWTELLVALS